MVAGNWQEWVFVAGYVGFLLVIATLVLTSRPER
jgi:hypothetical protein